MTPADLEAIRRPARVVRRDVDDPAAWRAIVEILRDLIAATTPDKPRRQ